MFEKFNEKAIKVMTDAQNEALEYLESLPRNQWVRLEKDKDFAFKDTFLGRIYKDL